ncbi:hypothetical protein EXIGLDRAFT_749546 [Exidia glandulosa HHB12029]|uniref:Extracellular membrane protein CFEM domain-containing protein n=1 Tax=Exidia glandulosa HHB12029 TaxID=1314781 RepID=A0A166AK13_EXIGL|nr:hypothetical protein EXIGLDRAFT_749546 [Exidia glandulosa HHB12029]
MRFSSLFVPVVTAAMVLSQSIDTACTNTCTQELRSSTSQSTVAQAQQCFKADSTLNEINACLCNGDLIDAFKSCFQKNCPDQAAELTAGCIRTDRKWHVGVVPHMNVLEHAVEVDETRRPKRWMAQKTLEHALVECDHRA